MSMDITQNTSDPLSPPQHSFLGVGLRREERAPFLEYGYYQSGL